MQNPGRISILHIEPSLRHYAWGDSEFIQNFLRLDSVNQPIAEAWYGAHPLGVSRIKNDDAQIALNERIQRDLYSWLGERITTRFGGLPFLMKVLAAEKPLSIQVHPNRIQAREGFEREEVRGVSRDASHRFFRDPNPKPELFVAVKEAYTLCGFRSEDAIRQILDTLPELKALLPPFGGAFALRSLLNGYYKLPNDVVQRALLEIIRRLSAERAESERTPDDPAFWVLRSHRLLNGQEQPDRGLFFIFLLNLLRMAPGEAIFLPAGVPHAYLRGVGLELMANSDNVLRAGLTSKPVDPNELIKLVRFDGVAPRVFEPEWDEAEGGMVYRTTADELQLVRCSLSTDAPITRSSIGPEILLAFDQTVWVKTEGTELEVKPGEGCLLSDGLEYTMRGADSATVFVASAPCARPREVRAPGRKFQSSFLDLPLNVATEEVFLEAIERNIAVTDILFESGQPPAIIGTVSDSSSAQVFWEQQLEQAKSTFRAREVLSLYEDLPVNQAFGLLLLWQRLRPRLQPGEGALMAFVSGDGGQRVTPLTEAECGQKAAIMSFAAVGQQSSRRYLSIAELALRYFAPVEAFLRRSGFDGMVVKWGDEVQIPTSDLSGHDPRFKGADIVRFVSVRPITAENAETKDWVGVDELGNVTAFIPRRPIEEMEPLADRGVFQRRDGQLYGGVNLGSIAVSRALLDLLLDEFSAEVNDVNADRRRRPDLDPQLFTALTIAALEDEEQRQRTWTQAQQESQTLRQLVENFPKMLERLVKVLDDYYTKYGRRIRMMVMDFEDQYWCDIGQHYQMYSFFQSLRDHDTEGRIARSLAGLSERWDENGNLISDGVVLGPNITVRNSVLIDVEICEGHIEDCVLVGTRAYRVEGKEAFDFGSTALNMRLAPRAGAYRTLAEGTVEALPGERLATILEPDGEYNLRVHETTNLKDGVGTYDIPIMGNPASFQEASDRVGVVDPVETTKRRKYRRAEIKKLINELCAETIEP